MSKVLNGQKVELTGLNLISPILQTAVVLEVDEETGVSVTLNLAKQEWIGKYLGWLVGKGSGFGKAANQVIASVFKSVQFLANRIGLPCQVKIVSRFEGDPLVDLESLPQIKNAKVTVNEGVQQVDFEVVPEDSELIGLS